VPLPDPTEPSSIQLSQFQQLTPARCKDLEWSASADSVRYIGIHIVIFWSHTVSCVIEALKLC
jgi:hypothetical protein